MRDTIVAVATGTATSAVAIVRLSGPAADDVLTLLTDRRLPTPRMASVRVLVDRDGQVLDEALVLRFLVGASYTGEPVVELHCHGGRAVVRAVLATILSEPGVRLAEPGEFSRRAFEAGRLDLAQVEALGDLIAAETEAQRKQAMLGFRGALHAMAAEWRADLLRAAALIEATIDWADEDVPEDVGEEVTRLIARVRAGLAQEKARVGAAMALRQGYEVALVGAPNVGKSSLLNALAGREAAITSPTPGTTRDVIELRYDLQGLPVIFLDMAGIRETADLLEAKGVNRARERARDATLRLFLQAPGIALVEGALKQPGDLIVWTKADLSPGPGDVVVSVELGSGIAELLAAIAEVLSARVEEAGVVGHIRQQSALLAAERVLDCTPVSPEELAEAVRSAMRALDGLIGRLGVEDVLGEVFSTFCLGK